MADAVSQLGSIGGGLIKNILGGIGIIAVSIGLFYGTRWIQKGTKKAKSFTINANILDLNGVLEFDRLAFIKAEDTGLLEMIFEKRKTDSIPPIPKHLIKNNEVLLLNYAPGHYTVIDTSDTVYNYSKGNWEITPVNLNMKKYITAKQREIMNKAEDKKKWWTEKAPWITLGVAAISAVLLAALIFYLGAYLEAKNITARVAECTR